MRRTMMGLLVVAAVGTGLLVAAKVAADDPPGGNPGLSWDPVSGSEGAENQSCSIETGNGCIDPQPKCYEQTFVWNAVTYNSFNQYQTYLYGFCKSPKGGTTATCTQYNTVKCCTTWVWYTTDCSLATGQSMKVTRDLYVKAACTAGGTGGGGGG